MEHILNTSDESAKFVTGIDGWVDRNGRFWGNDERMARWSGCTHIACKGCGKPTPKSYSICSDCREKKAIEKYAARIGLRWDGYRPLYSEATDKYFFNDDELRDHLNGTKDTIESLRLIICRPHYLNLVDEEYLCSDIDESPELPSDVMEALDALNEVINEQGPISWSPGKYGAEIKK